MIQQGRNPKDENQPGAMPPFHQRFNTPTGVEEAKRRFVNRVKNIVGANFPRLIELELGQSRYEGARRHLHSVANRLGEVYYDSYGFETYVGSDFHKCLLAGETLYKVFLSDSESDADILSLLLQRAIKLSETDLGIEWRDGAFWPSGAKLLDEALVNENLKWLSDLGYNNVLAPFEKGLRDFLEAQSKPERLADTVTDMYEAMEAMTKEVTGKDRELSRNAQLFISKLKLSKYYEKMLKDYIEYGCEYRHAIESGGQRVLPQAHEVEAFIYTTGLFIRLAIQRLNRATRRA